MATNVIRIKNAVFFAYHGAFKEEQSIGGKFEVDLDIFCDFTKAAETDSLENAVNYDEVYKFISKLVHNKKYYLIETLASVIADEVLNTFDGIIKLAVRVRKNSVPVGGVLDCVEAEVIKEANE